jgi:dienelactone hydrolase
MEGAYRLAALIVALACLATAGGVQAQVEFPPPQGKGPVVVAISGATGIGHYTPVSEAIARLGYDVMLFDGNTMVGTQGAAVKAAIVKAQQAPHGLGGKVALVGFSLGGGMSLFYGTQWPELVSGAVVWYPETGMIHNIPGWAGRTKIPVLMFAGEADTYKDCCLIGTAHALEAAANAARVPFELVTYPGVRHDFVTGGANYDAHAYADAFKRTAERLKQYLGP